MSMTNTSPVVVPTRAAKVILMNYIWVSFYSHQSNFDYLIQWVTARCPCLLPSGIILCQVDQNINKDLLSCRCFVSSGEPAGRTEWKKEEGGGGALRLEKCSPAFLPRSPSFSPSLGSHSPPPPPPPHILTAGLAISQPHAFQGRIAKRTKRVSTF